MIPSSALSGSRRKRLGVGGFLTVFCGLMGLALVALGLSLGLAERGDWPPVGADRGSAPSTRSSVTPSQAADCPTPGADSAISSTPAAGSSTSGTGILQGHMCGVGGPPPGVHEAWSGTVTITGSTVHRKITVGPDGAYAVALPAGKYDIEGRSPHFGGCAYPCYAQRSDSQRVLAGDTTTLDTYCSMD